jgi:hypothetical protein
MVHWYIINIKKKSLFQQKKTDLFKYIYFFIIIRVYPLQIRPERRLTDEDINRFVLSVKPIAMLVLFNNYEDDARSVFSSLSLLAPALIIPDLLAKLATASESLTEPHRYHVCIQVS